MKLKELNKIVESQNKFNEFIGKNERKVIILSDKYQSYSFKNVEELIKFFNKEYRYCGELTKETELYSDKGLIKFSFTYISYDMRETTETFYIFIR